MKKVTIGSSFIVIYKSWTDFKSIILSKFLNLQCEESDEQYEIFALDNNIVYECLIYKGTVPPTSGVDQAINDTYRSDFENNFQQFCNRPVDNKDAFGRKIMVDVPRVGSELILTTHNFCDPTTWYTDSIRVTDGYLTDSGDGYRWNSPYINWIDMVSGKLFDEDAIKLEAAHQWSVQVYVNGVLKTPCPPFSEIDGDYCINYNDGYIRFLENQSGQIVTASYSYANTSTWKIVPEPGKYIDIEVAEAQFSQDVIMNDTISFEIWAYNPYDLPNKFLFASTEYKKIVNLIDEALGSYPIIPAIGGPVRGTNSAIYGFPFRYGTVRSVKSSQGIELRVKLKDHKSFNGTHATATFYCTVHDEV